MSVETDNLSSSHNNVNHEDDAKSSLQSCSVKSPSTSSSIHPTSTDNPNPIQEAEKGDAKKINMNSDKSTDSQNTANNCDKAGLDESSQIRSKSKSILVDNVDETKLADWYDQWKVFIEAEVGFILPENKGHWLHQAITNYADKMNQSPQSLLGRAKYNKKLAQKIIETVLIPQSYFFRHQPTLDFIEHEAMHKCSIHNGNKIQGSKLANVDQSSGENLFNKNPENTAIKTDINNYNIISVGCSFGQEVWSIAMTLADADIPYRIWGFDVNESALHHAAKGRYDLNSLEEIPQKFKKFIKVDSKSWQVKPRLRHNVKFYYYNLVSSQVPKLPLVDAIICQNVLIYFRQFDQRDILNRLVSVLKKGGVLILAPGECVQWRHPAMKRQNINKVNAWQKIA